MTGVGELSLPQELWDEVVIPLACVGEAALDSSAHLLCIDRLPGRKKMAQTLMLVSKRWGFAARRILWEKVIVRGEDYRGATEMTTPFMDREDILESVRILEFCDAVGPRRLEYVLSRFPGVRDLTLVDDLHHPMAMRTLSLLDDIRVWDLEVTGEALDELRLATAKTATVSLLGSATLARPEGRAPVALDRLNVCLYSPLKRITAERGVLFEIQRIEIVCEALGTTTQSLTILLDRTRGIEHLILCILSEVSFDKPAEEVLTMRSADCNPKTLFPESEGCMDVREQRTLKELSLSFHLMRSGASAAGTLMAARGLKKLEVTRLEVFVIDPSDRPVQMKRLKDIMMVALHDVVRGGGRLEILWRLLRDDDDRDRLEDRVQACWEMGSAARTEFPARFQETVQELRVGDVAKWEWGGGHDCDGPSKFGVKRSGYTRHRRSCLRLWPWVVNRASSCLDNAKLLRSSDVWSRSETVALCWCFSQRMRLLEVHSVLREADYMPPARIRLLRLEGACCEWRHWGHFWWIDVESRAGKPIFFDAMPEGMALLEDWVRVVAPYLDAL
ncbi:hypothetical protein BDZ89DRAFT_1036532 [Hymenopellis radicata]|nr:hypothetical protein BDZ89DRAFT_1036532 [Hymenopellis radicata]